MPTAFVVTPATAPAPLNVVGEQITVLASGSQTGGYEIFRQAGPEGSGPPPHCHPWDESFYVVKGDIAFGVGDNRPKRPTTDGMNRLTTLLRTAVKPAELIRLILSAPGQALSGKLG
jgi:hypothetical protein